MLLIALIILALCLLAGGFAVHLIWVAAVVVLVIALITHGSRLIR